jgi:hypothetical protein
MSYGGTLRVLPRGTAMVPHYEVMHTIRKFHGWKHDPALGNEHTDPQTKAVSRQGGFKKIEASSTDHVITLDNTREYRKHLKEGDLWPADEATASECGVPFEPTFGGEHAPFPKAEASRLALTQLPHTDAAAPVEAPTPALEH